MQFRQDRSVQLTVACLLLCGAIGHCQTISIRVKKTLSKPVYNPGDGAQLVYIPGGPFPMGDDDREDNPRHVVTLSAYWIYRAPVTVKQYRQFCFAASRSMPPAPAYDSDWSRLDYPIVNVSWSDAQAYAKWAGGELPSEAQWERAARGTDARAYPWGNAYRPGKLWCSLSSFGDAHRPIAVGELGVSPTGCTDMAGNVAEWCRDWYEKDYWKTDRPIDPVDDAPASTMFRSVRGGSWYYFDPLFFRSAFRDWCRPDAISDYRGFRCAVSPSRIAQPAR
ncbi:MAG TPA: SUMF1/EgtB/PvdO family nonheme iron enzyme [Chthonomonadales bacterium]|nr:SUMF1/EgtB/PvdO family nonheme iron enzyme [Chthonomonadales bacterium]